MWQFALLRAHYMEHEPQKVVYIAGGKGGSLVIEHTIECLDNMVKDGQSGAVVVRV